MVNLRKYLAIVLLGGLFLAGCGLRRVSRVVNGGGASLSPAAASATPADAPFLTQTPIPTASLTPTATPDLTRLGFPAEQPGDAAFDFLAEMCQAQWFTENESLPCPGNESQLDGGFVMSLVGNVPGFTPKVPMLLTFPPRIGPISISSKYPDFVVRKGDRFRAILTCREHAFCDVEFLLGYFDEHGQTGLAHWRYLFTDDPLVVDYPLDGLAGRTVQFDLSVNVEGNRPTAYAVWIAPHIYRASR